MRFAHLASSLQAVFATSPQAATSFVLFRTPHNTYTTIFSCQTAKPNFRQILIGYTASDPPALATTVIHLCGPPRIGGEQFYLRFLHEGGPDFSFVFTPPFRIEAKSP